MPHLSVSCFQPQDHFDPTNSNSRLAFYWFLAWSIGGTLTHSISLANHELSHNLAFETSVYNAILGIFNNTAQAIPSAITFKRYHLEHHVFQGHDDHDTDIPSDLEAIICGKNFILKIIWVFLQPLWYALRPILTKPKNLSLLEAINTCSVILFDAWFAYTFGVQAVLFNAMSTLLGMGLHPCAGHFIAEHYTFTAGQETYSYYGPLNWICFNVGYHNEHHDFPKVSGFRLPEVRAIAPEYYDERWKNPNDGIGMVTHKSWPGVIYQFITNPDMGPSMRIKRRKGNKSNKKAE